MAALGSGRKPQSTRSGYLCFLPGFIYYSARVANLLALSNDEINHQYDVSILQYVLPFVKHFFDVFSTFGLSCSSQ